MGSPITDSSLGRSDGGWEEGQGWERSRIRAHAVLRLARGEAVTALRLGVKVTGLLGSLSLA